MQESLALYVHWPFCAKKCPYCDYNSHVRASVDQDSWREALCAELASYRALCGGRTVSSVFFGGGTPSLMPPVTVAAVLETLAAGWKIPADCEITLEANPTHLETRHFADFRAAGITRLSVGVQALRDDALRFLGREHSAVQARAALEAASRYFDRWSCDLMWGRPGQTCADWQAELREALACGPQHLSLYQLSIEDDTAFARRWQQGEFILPDADMLADLDALTEAETAACCLQRYEISSFAVPGQECRHNLGYWGYHDYIGIGPGAHGRITLATGEGRAVVVTCAAGQESSVTSDAAPQKIATETHHLPERWRQEVTTQGHGRSRWQVLSVQEQTEELLLLGLRLQSGIPAARWQAVTGQPLAKLAAQPVVAELVADGLLEPVIASLRATVRGRLFLNRIEEMLLASVSESQDAAVHS
jgi:putative oxygen-independent coproporphyrinogen III oxidase